MDVLRTITMWLGDSEPSPLPCKLTEAELKAIGYGFPPLEEAHRIAMRATNVYNICPREW
jgi:hypothetical protein